MSKQCPLHVVLIGNGQIANSQHIPVIQSRPDAFCLDAIVDVDVVGCSADGVPSPNNKDETNSSIHQHQSPLYFTTLAEATSKLPNLNVAILTCPPQHAQEYAATCLGLGFHVLMEKPPGLDHHNLMCLLSKAKEQHATLYTACHSIMCPQMANAKGWISKLQEKKMIITSIKIVWKENAQKWHPGQTWIKERSGLGVLDILFNPLSMIDYMFEEATTACADATDDENKKPTPNNTRHLFHVKKSRLDFPKNWSSPIAGETKLTLSFGKDHYLASSQPSISIDCDYAWNYEADDVWNISITCQTRNDGDGSIATSQTIQLNGGGSQLVLLDEKGKQQHIIQEENEDILRPEYESLYDQFLYLINTGKSEVRQAPLQIINDILDNSTVTETKQYDV